MRANAKLACLWAGVLGLAIPWAAGAAEVVGVGPAEFEARCAVCHGLDGRGDGPFAPLLVQPPADLTQLARAAGGSYPAERIYRIIDGRDLIAAHGTREMPIWGRELLVDYRRQESAIGDPERFVRDRIMALVDYLRRLQLP